MNLDKSYLGFTDKKVPMQKAKIEAALDKLIWFEGDICAKKDFIFWLLLRGHKPMEKLNDGRINIRTYERLEDKMEYRMQVEGENSYYTVTKTEYDFACYIFAQSLASEGSAMKFMDAERERLEREREARNEQLEREMEEKLAAQQAKKDFKLWLEEQAAAYSNQERMDLMRTVFLNLVGASNPNPDLLVLIENIDRPMCRNKLISWLHNGNKASRKTFECVTGLKLPKAAKETRAFLSSVSAAEYKEPLPFKMRRPATKTPAEPFYILSRDGYKEVTGEPLVKYGFTWFIHNSSGLYHISEACSGIKSASGKTRKLALDELKGAVGRLTIEGIKQSVEGSIANHGLSPRYKDTEEGQKAEEAA
jgi:hypothetical protein